MSDDPIREARLAKELLGSEAFAITYERVGRKLAQRWMREEDRSEREKLWYMQKAAGLFKAELEGMVQRGEVIELQLKGEPRLGDEE